MTQSEPPAERDVDRRSQPARTRGAVNKGMDNTVIRSGDSGDVDTLLRFFDEAVEWLVARGSSKQWGTEPWSRVPKRVERVKGGC
jgi:hypothetical protein